MPLPRHKYFNPRLHEGGDLVHQTGERGDGSFNPRLHEGGDLPLIPGLAVIQFQSTPPRGRRHDLNQGESIYLVSIHASTREATWRSSTLIDTSKCFNPRLHEGGDLRVMVMSQGCHRFQSTPPRGRRQDGIKPEATCTLFQSTPPRGRRPSASQSEACRHCFNPRLHEGGDISI